MFVGSFVKLVFVNFSLDEGIFMTVFGILDCALLCLTPTNCSSLFYNKKMLSCAPIPARYLNTTELAPRSDTNYYSIGTGCVTHEDCLRNWQADSMCIQGICVCVLGYRSQPGDDSCVLQGSLVNVSKHKPARCSSRWDEPPGVLVDGNRDDNYTKHSCFATSINDASPWWQVDLLKEYLVHKVYILNRGDDELYRMHSLDIEVYTKNPETEKKAVKQTCFDYRANFTGYQLELKCILPVIGRYVRIHKVRKCSRFDILQMCEVDIFVTDVQ